MSKAVAPIRLDYRSCRDPLKVEKRVRLSHWILMHKDDKGDLSEAKALSRLLELGYKVSIPWGKNQRYDMIVDTGNDLVRAQCKTGWLDHGCITFMTASTNRNCGWKDYKGKADWFLVYYQDTDRVYRILVDDCGVNATALRIEPTSSAHPAIRWAEDYLL